ncbi:MAG: glycosyltransferase family 4 protein [Propionibacteriaceae bacterium]|nr:glycosyltransferase family 4 protein [Propionibacteriaceae bacterium]
MPPSATVPRVAQVIHSLGAGGAEKVLTDLSRVHHDAGFEMIVIGLSSVEDPLHADQLRAAGVRVYALERGRFDPRAIPLVAGILTAERIDLVHTHLKHADIVGGVAAWRCGLPQVTTLHLIEEPTDLRGRGKLALASAVRNARAARILAVSRAQREWYVRDTRVDPGRVEVLPNGVGDPQPIAPAVAARLRAELDVPPEAVVGLMVTVMRPGKGHGTLLEAVRRIPRDSPLVIGIAGSGELEPMIRAEVNDDPVLRQRVRLLGYRTDVAALLQAVDFVVHPTEADALPTTLIEAAACTRAVVASDVGGVPDIVTPDTGILLPPKDPAALAGALTRLAAEADTRARLGAAARERYEQVFDAGRWAGRLGDLYRSLVSARPA